MSSKFNQCKKCAIKCPPEIQQAKLRSGRIPFDNCLDFDPVITNADKIRNMTDKEMAEFINEFYSNPCKFCDYLNDTSICDHSDSYTCIKDRTIGTVFKWLMKEAEKE